ncbi:reverse transcriptase domain-containing protein [Tanacetum coccineum]
MHLWRVNESEDHGRSLINLKLLKHIKVFGAAAGDFKATSLTKRKSSIRTKKQSTSTPESCLRTNSRHQLLPSLPLYSSKQPMWAADRVVAPTPGSEITIPETANEFAIKGTIETYDELRTAFISRYFSPALFDRLLVEIRAFSQHENESLTDAWLRMKEMLRNCHGHNLSVTPPNEAWTETRVRGRDVIIYITQSTKNDLYGYVSEIRPMQVDTI